MLNFKREKHRGGAILCKEEYKKIIDKAVFPGTQGGPLEHIIAAKAVSFKEALSDDFKNYSKQIIKNAKAMEEVFRENGVKMVSGGTDNHLLLLDVLSSFEMTGKEAEALLEEAFITTNKNTIPNETLSPFVTSGIRIGTPAITTRGMKEKEAKLIANWIIDLLRGNKKAEDVKGEVLELTKEFPLYK